MKYAFRSNIFAASHAKCRLLAILSAAFLSCASLSAQVIGWNHPAAPPPYGVFSIGTGNAGVETGRSITLDASGNVYVYGTFAGTADFDPSGASNTSTANGTSSDVFIAKYNASGAFQWVARGGVANSGDNGSGNIGAIRTDGTNVYVVGSLAVSGASATFTPAGGGCTCTEPLNATTTRGFVGKLDAATGTWQWMNSFGGIGTTQNGGHGVALDPTGNIYVVGQASGTFTLGALPAISVTDAQIFFAKLNAAGTWQWAKTAGGTGGDGAGQSGGGITYNSNLGRVTATGSYNSTGVTFGGIGIANSTGNDIFLTELDPSNGSFLSAFGLGGGGAADECGGVVYDPQTHDIFLGGQMSGSLTLPGFGTLLQAGAGNDSFVGRFVPGATPASGVFSWGKSFGLAGSDRAYDVATNANGRIYITGWFTGPGTIDFGAGAATQVTSTGTGNDIYVASLSVAGVGAWAVQGVEPGANLDQGRGVWAARDNSGTVWATGQFNVGTVNWTPSSLGNTITLTSAGTSDVWVGKIYGVLPLSATQSQANILCNGTCAGSATVVASGGVPPYTYSWSPSGGSGATASTLCAAIYTCTITDAAGSSIPKNFTITQPPAIVLTAASQTNVSCNGGANGAASVNPATGGTGSLSYNWTPGNPTGDGTVSVTGLTAGSWTCTVTDANSCTKNQVFNITQPPTPLAGTTSVTNPSLPGACDGSATVFPSGGTAPYTFNWSPSGGTGATTTPLCAGSYSVNITDFKSCNKPVPAVLVDPVVDIAGTSLDSPAPLSTVLGGLAFTPKASFTNNGSTSRANVPVRFRITGPSPLTTEIYNQTATIASLGIGASAQATFSNATISVIGTYTMYAKSEQAGDSTPGNDEVSATFVAKLVGAVSGGSGPNPPLIVHHNTGDATKLDLAWGASCGTAATDFAVYEGSMGNWTSHLPSGGCTTSGAPSYTAFAPSAGNTYYLIVPLEARAEGSYGQNSAGAEIPASAAPCRAVRLTLACP